MDNKINPKIAKPIHLDQNDGWKENFRDALEASTIVFGFSISGWNIAACDSLAVVFAINLSFIAFTGFGSMTVGVSAGIALLPELRVCSNSDSNLSAREEILRLSSPFIFSREAMAKLTISGSR